MINFKTLKFVVDSKYSFVGIEKKLGILYFYLPKGFEKEINRGNVANNSRELFFLFYKIYNKFKKICIEKDYLDECNSIGINDRDGIISSANGININDDGDDLENIFYSKLDIIGCLLNTYDEPKILSLEYRLRRSCRFDLTKIHRHLHQAIYLPNNAVYFDQMPVEQRLAQFESTDIVTMYCYLFCEIKNQIKEKVNPEIESLSERFQQKHLGNGDSIFDDKSYERILNILKNTLEIINNNTPIKDIDYYLYYDAIELFLYGDLSQLEDGKIWGVSNFYNIWESMCLTYISRNVQPPYLLHLDSQYVIYQTLDKLQPSSRTLDLSNYFRTTSTVPLAPDAVLLSLIASQTRSTYGYRIQANRGRNDNFYQTYFRDIDKMDNIKITYIHQKKYYHTIEKLYKIYEQNRDETIIINSRLPKRFYSFWNVPESIDSEYIHKMCLFNHLFYIALEMEITTWDDFDLKLLKPLGVVFDLNLSWRDSHSNAFTHSLFRDRATQSMYSVESIKQGFAHFIEQALKISTLYADLFEVNIIDVKYLISDYFKDVNEIENIKKRSVRKQFVYEYLVQRGLHRRRDKYKNLNICSSFWLPSYRPDDPNLIEDGETFMDGYIQLKNINFAVLAENYIA